MKNKHLIAKIIIALSAIIMIWAFSSCSSPCKGEEGTLSVSLGSANGRQAMNTETVFAGMEHLITLEGPDGSLSKSFTGGGPATFELEQGN